MTPAYAQHRLALQTLQSRQPTERWVLKTPNHLWHLDALLATYPDARVIWTHRDPGPVVTSLASLANAGQRPLTSRTRPPARRRGVEAQVCVRSQLGDVLRRRARRRAGASTSTTTRSWPIPLRRSARCTGTLRRGGDAAPRPAHAGVSRPPAAGRLRAPPLRPGRLRLDLRRPRRRIRGLRPALPDRAEHRQVPGAASSSSDARAAPGARDPGA